MQIANSLRRNGSAASVALRTHNKRKKIAGKKIKNQTEKMLILSQTDQNFGTIPVDNGLDERRVCSTYIFPLKFSYDYSTNSESGAERITF